MIQLLSPALLALMALAVPILILWMLKLRRREVPVSSTMLWQRLLRDKEANAPWQRLRRNLLLFLQLAALIALVLALARPFLPVPAVAGGAVVLLLDASASMNATDVRPNRFAVAQQAAEQMVRELGEDGVMTVIAAGQQPRILAPATRDKSALLQAISFARPEIAPSDWSAAFALAAGAVRGAEESTIVVISDGDLPDDLPPVPGEVRYLPIGREGGAENLAITALAVQSDESSLELFINLIRTGPDGTLGDDPLLSIYLDGELYHSQRITVPLDENTPLTLTDLPADTQVVEARLQVEDHLELDNTAWAIPSRGAGDERRVLIVSAGNLFLERAIASLPGVNAFRIGPESQLPVEQFDLYVFDGVFPEPSPVAPLLLVDPPEENSLLAVSGTLTNTRISRVAQDELMAYVDFGQVWISEARLIELPPWPETVELVRAQGGPLLFAGVPDGQRVVVIAFDLHQSDLPLQIAFPVLIANLVEWLTPGLPFDAGEGLSPGEPLTLYPGDAERAEIIRPDGVTLEVNQPAPDDRSQLTFAATEQPGLYQVVLDGEVAGQFAVNLFDPSESTLTRRDAITVGPAEITPEVEQELGQKELWSWLVAGALLLLFLEWWVYHRSIPVPKRR